MKKLDFIFVIFLIMITIISIVVIIKSPIDNFSGIMAILGWFSLIIVTIVAHFINYRLTVNFAKEKMIILNNTRTNLEKANFALNQVFGYCENFNDGCSIYSQMLNREVHVSIANAIVIFASNIKKTDSVFLIKINNEEQNWNLQIAGCPIHIELAKEVLSSALNKCIDISGNNSIIFTHRKINN